MQNGIGFMQGIDEAHLVGVAINRQSIRRRQGWSIYDGGGNVAFLAQQMPLHIQLQFSQRNFQGVHAACRECRAARSRATLSSATSSPNSGMLSSRSIMVGTSPKVVSAWRYKSHTGGAMGWSCVSIKWPPILLCPAR